MSGRPYQGYPYVNPVVIDAPSLSASEVAALSKWRDLPTRKVTTQPGQKTQEQQNRDLPAVFVDLTQTEKTNISIYPHYPSTIRKPKQNTKEPDPVIYIDLPEGSFSGSSVTQSGFNSTRGVNDTSGGNNTSGGNITSCVNETKWANSGVSGTSGVNGNRANVISHGYEDNDENDPVVYVDIPESDESHVLQYRLADTEPEPDTQKTTFNDSREATTSQPGSSQRPCPPNNLDLTYPGTSRTEHSSLPSFLSKEASVYGRQPTPDDGFSLPPIPLNEFPKPPPSYEEAARAPSSLQVPQIRPDLEPARTQVITHNSENNVVGQAHLDRKLVHCQHCGKQVNTLVTRETGLFTHVFAWAFMFCCLFPITIGVYSVDQFKHRNHYCPNCNKKIGFEIPFLCTGMHYVGQ